MMFRRDEGRRGRGGGKVVVGLSRGKAGGGEERGQRLESQDLKLFALMVPRCLPPPPLFSL